MKETENNGSSEDEDRPPSSIFILMSGSSVSMSFYDVIKKVVPFVGITGSSGLDEFGFGLYFPKEGETPIVHGRYLKDHRFYFWGTQKPNCVKTLFKCADVLGAQDSVDSGTLYRIWKLVREDISLERFLLTAAVREGIDLSTLLAGASDREKTKMPGGISDASSELSLPGEDRMLFAAR